MSNYYDARTISNFIVNYALSNNKVITNLKLQKLLYFLQLKFIGDTGKPIFLNSIEKWKLGPVVPDVYHDYKMFGSNPITFAINNPFAEEEKISFDDEEKIKEVVDDLIDINSFKLVERAHGHSAWKNYKREIFDGVKGLKYSLKELREAYEEDREVS